MEKRKKLHLLWRSGFGPNTESFDDLDKWLNSPVSGILGEGYKTMDFI